MGTATTTTHVGGGKDKPMVMTQTLVFLDCLAATTGVTVGRGGGDARLQERTVLVSGSLVSRLSWEEVEEITAAVTVDTTRGDTTKDTTRDTTKGALDSTKEVQDSIKEDVV